MGAAYLADWLGYWRDQEEVEPIGLSTVPLNRRLLWEEQGKTDEGMEKAICYSFNWAKEED